MLFVLNLFYFSQERTDFVCLFCFFLKCLDYQVAYTNRQTLGDTLKSKRNKEQKKTLGHHDKASCGRTGLLEGPIQPFLVLARCNLVSLSLMIGVWSQVESDSEKTEEDVFEKGQTRGQIKSRKQILFTEHLYSMIYVQYPKEIITMLCNILLLNNLISGSR